MAELLAICRGEPATAPAITPAGDTGSVGDTQLFPLAAHHGQLGVLLLALERAGRLPPEQARTLLFLRRQAALWDIERDGVMARLAEAGIPAVLLKGAALRLTGYHDPAERPFGDIDVLVARDDLDAAVRSLTSLGYSGQSESLSQLYLEHHHHLILNKPPGFKVEMHWALLPVRYPLKLDPTAFLRETVELASASRHGIRAPRPELMLLHVAVQNVEDNFAKLRRLVDIDRITRSAAEFDWDYLARETRRLRLESVTALSLRLTQLLLGTPLPAGFIARLGMPTLSRLHLPLLDPVGLVVDHVAKPRTAVQRLLLVWSVANGRDRARFLRDIVNGQADWFWRAVEGDGSIGNVRWHDLIAFGKTAAYQLALYPGAQGRRRPGTFWDG